MILRHHQKEFDRELERRQAVFKHVIDATLDRIAFSMSAIHYHHFMRRALGED